jgi:hypothetical protein
MAAAQSHAQNHVQNQVQNRSQGLDLVERRVRLQKQEELADRLNLLLHKEVRRPATCRLIDTTS